MAGSRMVRASDYQVMLRTMGELADLPPDPLVRRAHALHSLAPIFGASAGFFAETGLVRGRYTFFRPVTTGMECLGSVLDAYLAGQLPFDPCGLALDANRNSPSRVALRRDLLPDAAWYAGGHYEAFRSLAHLDDGIYARITHPQSKRNLGMCFLRQTGERPFTPRHREILRVFNDAAAPLYLVSQTESCDPLEGLPPRLRRVAECLLRGMTIKEAAAELGLSPSTVMDYTKPLYRMMGVRSQSELLALVLPHRRLPPIMPAHDHLPLHPQTRRLERR